MIKELLRKRLLEHTFNESVPMVHFKERVNEVLYDIKSIQIPQEFYLPNIPKETQDAYIIKQIQSQIQSKIDAIIEKDYPTGGSCVLAPLGVIKIQPIKGNPTNIIVTANKKEGIVSGFGYYVTIYDNRLPTLVLADPNNPNNVNIGSQLQAHIDNTTRGGYPVNKSKCFIDKSFISNILIPMSGLLS